MKIALKNHPKIFWSREESKERFPLPISPLGWSLLLEPTQSTLDSLAQHLNVRKVHHSEMLRNLNYYVYARKGFFTSRLLLRVRFGFWFYLIAFFLRFGALAAFNSSSSLGRAYYFWANLFERLFISKAEDLIAQWTKIHETLIPKMRETSVGPKNNLIELSEFLHFKRQMEQNSREYFHFDFGIYFFKNILLQWLRYSLKKANLSERQADETISNLTQGLSSNFSVRMALDFQGLTTTQWLQRYGHLTDNWDVAAPTLAESEMSFARFTDPLKLQKLLNLHLKKDETRRMTEQYLASLFQSVPQVIKCISLFQKILLIDEDMRAYSSIQYPAIRELFHRVASTAGWHKDLIYFLSIDEVEAGLKQRNFNELKSIAINRQMDFANALKMAPLDEMVEEQGEMRPVKITATPKSAALCVSPGQAFGRALVVHQLDDLRHFSSDSILVLRSATPTYAPYYSHCAGIISETGGLLSHGALVAREFQIPMISNVSQSLELIQTGDMIRLDATAGEFEISQRPQEMNFETWK